jgi:L-lactate utilization protein LutC
VNEKLYVVVRSDLSSGDMACQAIHAAATWCVAFPERARQWHESNYLVLLAVNSDEEFHRYLNRCRDMGFKLAETTEPDLDNMCTAFAVEHDAGRWLSSLPLAFKEPVMT